LGAALCLTHLGQAILADASAVFWTSLVLGLFAGGWAAASMRGMLSERATRTVSTLSLGFLPILSTYRLLAFNSTIPAVEPILALVAAATFCRHRRVFAAFVGLSVVALAVTVYTDGPSVIPAVVGGLTVAGAVRYHQTRAAGVVPGGETAAAGCDDTESALREVTENVNEVFFVLSADFSTALYASPAFAQVWQRSPEELVQDSDAWRDAIHPFDKPRVLYAFEQASEDAAPLDEEFRVVRPDGSERWIWIRTFPITDADGLVRRNAGIAEDVTVRKAAEIELAMARDQEMSIGAKIQKRLLLEEPDVATPGFDVGALSLPSQRVDGDFYNFFSFEPNSVDLLIGDVMGKGIPAALVGAGAKSTFLKAKVNLLLGSRSTIPRPVDIVREAHYHLVEELIGLENFLTLHYLRLNGETRELQYVDCGNTPIVLYRSRTDTCWTIKGSNVPLGFLRNEQYEQFAVPLDPGDLLLCYSDGITEAENPEDGPFGEERLLHFVRAHHGCDPIELVNNLTEVLQTYVGGSGFRDDVTAVAFRVKGFAGASRSKTHTFDCRIGELGSLRGFVRHELSQAFPHLADPEIEDSLVLAANELFANIVQHGGSVDDETGIPVEISIRGNTVYLQMRYGGEFFDWTTHQQPEIESMEEHGYGMYIINQLADSVVYCRDQTGSNLVWLAKEIPVSITA
jgi:sigma-B regulation protein RsbU (phosphoserine phosphatase)